MSQTWDAQDKALSDASRAGEDDDLFEDSSLSAEQQLIRERIPYWNTQGFQELLRNHGIRPELAEKLLGLAFHRHYEGGAGSLRPTIQQMLREEVSRQLTSTEPDE